MFRFVSENHFELRIFSEAKLALPREVLPVLQECGLPGEVADGGAGQGSTGLRASGQGPRWPHLGQFEQESG